MWKGKKVSVVFGTYREKKSIRAVIENFFATGLVDEIIVVNNNAEEGTDEEVKKTAAKLVYEKRQGLGWAYRRGIDEAAGDYVVLSEADGTFVAPDIERLLAYAEEFSVVFGTRTNKGSISEGAAMGFLRKSANIFEAKMIEVLFAANSVTDIGCIYRLLSREAVSRLRPLWCEGGALFPTEILLLAAAERIKFIEIPVSFRERVGESGLTARWYSLMKWGLRIFFFIIIFWLRWVFRTLTGRRK